MNREKALMFQMKGECGDMNVKPDEEMDGWLDAGWMGGDN